jgi:hypothetical protein
MSTTNITHRFKSCIIIMNEDGLEDIWKEVVMTPFLHSAGVFSLGDFRKT